MTAVAHAAPIELTERRQARAVARIRSGPAHIRVEKGRLIAFCMDAQTLTRELIDANGAAIQNLLHLPPGPERDEAVRATHRVHEKAVAALNEWLAATDRYEQTPPITG
jgi:hypothetical protein